MNGVTAMDENGEEIKSPIRRLGSTRKLLVFNNIRLQLNEQLRCLDVRMESQVSLIQELQDFFRRRGELEMDYSKSLDKLAKSLQLRHKEQKQKREQWPLFSSYACWQQLVNQTKSLSKDHAALSEIYSVHLVTRLQTVIEDVQRIYKRCREIGYETHEEILRVLQELHTTMKTYHSYQTECKAAEAKLRTAETQRMKLQQTIPKEKLERSKKYRLTEKEVLKRKNKYTDARLKALKAKNEYQLCLEASNTTIHKYFVEDLSDLIDCMDLGFGSMVSRAILMHVTADQGRCRAILQNSENLSHSVHSMDSRADKQKFLEQHHGAFMIPKRLEFQGQQNDDPIEPELQKALHQEMEQRLQLLGQRVNNLRAESEEIWKTLETAEINLLEHLNTKDYDTSSLFGDGSLQQSTQWKQTNDSTTKLKADKQEIEEFYISKIREYILGTSRIARLDAKAELLRNALAKDPAFIAGPLIVKSTVPKRKRIGRMNMSGHPKLFGGSLEEYLEATGEEIPLIMRSCIRIINLYGLHHQGIFRVSGSQVEISNFREGFERGEDPLADTTDASDINSVAGVLKLYLRELREPLFPIIYFDHFVSLAQLESKHEIVLGIKKFLQSLPRSVVIVMRYLFAFLNHLSEYADENMMDAYNLAICFGPTLMPAPEDKDQVQYQNQVNELIKNMIVYHEELFPKDLGGIQYEKYISEEPFIDIDVGDSPTDQVTEDPDSEVYPSEDESDTLEATVQFDFNARSSRELSLRKGETVILRKQVSNDWWQGTVNGKEGLVPDKYISLKIKDEDRDKTSEHMKSSSSEESVRKRRPSGNMSINSQLSIFNQHQQHQHQQQQQPPSSQQQQQQQQLSSTQSIDSSSTEQSLKYPMHHIQQSQQQQQQQQQQSVHQLLNEKIDSMVNNKLAASGVGGGGGGGGGSGSISGGAGGGSNSSDDCDFHYDSVDNVKVKYNYHDEPHSFENSMDFLEDFNHFQFESKKPEPIYAEPSKPSSIITATALSSSSTATSGVGIAANSSIKSGGMHFDEYDGVILRNLDANSSSFMPSSKFGGLVGNRKSETLKTTSSENSNDDESDGSGGGGGGIGGNGNGVTNVSDSSRHSDGNLFKDTSLSSENGSTDENDVISPTRKYHTKSFSLSENRIGGGGGGGGGVTSGLNLFQQNRELWEKRAELNSQQSLNQSRILERKRIAPDLVMDLPLSANKDAALRSSRDSLDMESLATEELTSAERFASQNQCTLKKNERFSTSIETMLDKKEVKLETKIIEKPKAEVKPQQEIITPSVTTPRSGNELKTIETSLVAEKKAMLGEVLHIEEDTPTTPLSTTTSITTTGTTNTCKDNLSTNTNISSKEIHKSPIPARNTQKYVSQFADLKLTGGCLSQPDSTFTTNTQTTTTSCGSGGNKIVEQTPQLTSFKPQVKVKPQIFKKPFSRQPTTPEMPRRGGGGSGSSQD